MAISITLAVCTDNIKSNLFTSNKNLITAQNWDAKKSSDCRTKFLFKSNDGRVIEASYYFANVISGIKIPNCEIGNESSRTYTYI